MCICGRRIRGPRGAAPQSSSGSRSHVLLSCPGPAPLLRGPAASTREPLRFGCDCSRTNLESQSALALPSRNPDVGQQVLVCLSLSNSVSSQPRNPQVSPSLAHSQPQRDILAISLTELRTNVVYLCACSGYLRHVGQEKNFLPPKTPSPPLGLHSGTKYGVSNGLC